METVIKGDVAVGDVIEVSQLGGSVEKGVNGVTKKTTYVSPDTTMLEEVESTVVLLMLADHASEPFDLLNPIQALYSVSAGGSIDSVSKDSSAITIDDLAEVKKSAE